MRTIINVSLVLALLSGSGAAAQPDQAAIDLAAAIRTETIDGDLDAAIQQYATIAETSDRAIAAEALIRMGGAYEKLGKPEALEVYQQVLNEYADEAEPVAEARGRLAALDVERVAPPTLTVREFQYDERFSDISGPGGTRFALSGDGQTFVYTDWATGDLAMTNMATGEVRRFFGTDWATSDSWFETPVFSPDEERVAFVRYPNRNDAGGTRIEVSPLNGETREAVYEFGPAKSRHFARTFAPHYCWRRNTGFRHC